MSAFTNTQRQTRTESRIKELLTYTSTPRYRYHILAHFKKEWGVGETTISRVIQEALRMGELEYADEKYQVVK